MAEEGLKHKAVKGAFWNIGQTLANQAVAFVISVIIARLVLPKEFGLVAMLSVFIAIANCFIESGISVALLRKNDRTNVDCSTMLYFNILMAGVCYVILFFLAPIISEFYKMGELTNILRVTALGLIIGATATVQRMLFRAALDFKTPAICDLVSYILSGAIGIFLAYHKWGVWALVTQNIIGTIFSALFLWLASRWRPIWAFSFESLRESFGFGSKLLISGLIDTAYNQIYPITIGKFFSASQLAYFNRAFNLSSLASTTPTKMLSNVAFPILCKLQDSDDRLSSGYQRMIRITSFIVFPLTIGLGAIAYPLINVLLTEEWIEAAPLLQIAVFSGMWYPIHLLNLNLLQVKGRSDLFLKLEIAKKILGLSVIFITIPLGIKAMCYGAVISSVLCLCINTHYTKRLIGLGLVQQARDFMRSLLLSLVMFAACRVVIHFTGDGIIGLICGIATGIIVYGGIAITTKMDEVKELRTLLKRK